MSRNNLSGFDPFASAPGSSSASNNSNTSRAPPQQPSMQQPFSRDARQIQSLQQQGFSSGLIHAFLSSKDHFPLRIWILDNSAAMNVQDSHRISGTFDNIQNIPGMTRWQELQDCVAYHSQLAAMFQFPTRFAVRFRAFLLSRASALTNKPIVAVQLLNDPGSHIGPQYFSVAEHGAAQIAGEMQVIQTIMTQTRPAGPTLLTEQIAGLTNYIQQIAPRLRAQQQTVSIIITTQGVPSDRAHLLQTLQRLEGLPVWVVIRLCTDDENVFDFYNDFDRKINLPYDVLDDFFGESLEVYLRNPWLTYGLSLHRIREFGYKRDVLDTLDERQLTLPEVKELCQILFGAQLPDPTTKWIDFFQAVSTLQAREKPQWNPVTRKVTPWINLHDFNRLYGGQVQAPQQQQYYYASSVPQQQPYRYPQPQQASWQQPARPPPSATYPQQQSATQRPPNQYPPQAPQPPPPAQQSQAVPPPATVSTTSGDANLKTSILHSWALQPPTFGAPKPIHYLIGTIHTTFPPSFGVQPHDYFSKWKPMSLDALSSGQPAVLKRAIRKMKFFLHPDKLPRDFTDKQLLLCKVLWDVTADAEEQQANTQTHHV